MKHGISHQTLWAQKLRNECTRQLMFALLNPPPPLTRWQRWKNRWRRRITLPFVRVRDAWLVLTGKAEIYEGQDD